MKLPVTPAAVRSVVLETYLLFLKLSRYQTEPPRTVKSLIAFSKQRPGEVIYGSSGVGTTVHLSGALFEYMTGVKWLHVPYKGAGPALIDMLGGQFSLYFGNMPSVIGYARQGKLNAIATTGAKRSPATMDIPTVAESGVPGYEVTTWYGSSAPAKTPRAIVDKLAADYGKVLRSKEVTERLLKEGIVASASTPEEFGAFIAREIEVARKIVAQAGIKVE